MSSENYSDTLPILADRGFDTSMRGYDRRQVDVYVATLDDEIRAAAADRDAALARCADFAAQLASAQAQIESLRRQLRKASEKVTADNLEPRVRELLDTAAADASKMRADADAYVLTVRRTADESAERIRSSARQDAEQIVADATQRLAESDDTFRRRIAEVEQHRTELTSRIQEERARAQAEEDQLTIDAQAERVRLDEQAVAERARLDVEAAAERARLQAEIDERVSTAEKDFEITLRLRRTEEGRKSAAQVAAAEAQAEQIRVDAHAAAEDLLREARAELGRLNDRRVETHTALRELHEKIAKLLADIEPPLPSSPREPAKTAKTEKPSRAPAKPRGRVRS
jgi:cell division septum initiation protein DivIVA